MELRLPSWREAEERMVEAQQPVERGTSIDDPGFGKSTRRLEVGLIAESEPGIEIPGEHRRLAVLQERGKSTRKKNAGKRAKQGG